MRTVILTFAAAFLFAAAARAVDIPNPLADAVPGEWVLMEDVSGEETGERTKVTLTAIDAERFTICLEHIDADGAVVERNEHTFPLAEHNRRMAEMAANAKETAEDFVFIGDAEYPTVSVHVVTDDKDADGNAREFKLWISDSLPIGGLAKTWSSDPKLPDAEVIDFGFTQ